MLREHYASEEIAAARMSAFWGQSGHRPDLRNSESAAADNGATTVSDNGLITISSAHSVKDTIDRVETDIKLKGLTVFARVDHAAAAMEVGLWSIPITR